MCFGRGKARRPDTVPSSASKSTSTLDAGKPPGSSTASCIVASSTSGYHILKIHGYYRTKKTANGESIKSRPFNLGGYSWCIRYYPNGRDAGSADYISLFLHLDQEVTKTVNAQIKFRFMDKVGEDDGGQPPFFPSETIYKFESNGGWGWATFVKREDFERSNRLRDDSFTVRCDITINDDIRTEEMHVVSLPPSDLHRHLGSLLHTEIGADVAFKVGAETIRGHRCVLASRSPVFAAELFGPMKESRGGTISIEDMDVRVFRALLYFIYTDSLPEMCKEDGEDAMLQHLLVAADRYSMERLKLICEDKLCRLIEETNVATILALAEQHHCCTLKKACLHFLSSPLHLLAAVLASDGFKHLRASCPSVLKELTTTINSKYC